MLHSNDTDPRTVRQLPFGRQFFSVAVNPADYIFSDFQLQLHICLLTVSVMQVIFHDSPLLDIFLFSILVIYILSDYPYNNII